jgi:hypothetical protein
MAENQMNPLNSASNSSRTTRRRFSHSENLLIVEAAGDIPTTYVTQVFGHMGERLRHLGAFPKCIGKKPSPPPARARSRDFPEEKFSSSLREVPLVWDVHQKIPNEIQCAPSDEIKLAGQVCSPNLRRSRCNVYQRVGLNCAKLHATNMCILN